MVLIMDAITQVFLLVGLFGVGTILGFIIGKAFVEKPKEK